MRENIGDTPENKQYVEGIKAIIDHGNGKISAETEKLYLEHALMLTVPDYKIFLHKSCAEVYPYTEHEIIILINLDLALQIACSGITCRNIHKNNYNIGKQKYRQAYYLALARKDNILAEKLKNGYLHFVLHYFHLISCYHFLQKNMKIFPVQLVSKMMLI